METAVAFAVILASIAVLVASLMAIFVLGYFLYIIRATLTTARRLKRSTTDLGTEVRDVFLHVLRAVPSLIIGQKEKKSRSAKS